MTVYCTTTAQQYTKLHPAGKSHKNHHPGEVHCNCVPAGWDDVILGGSNCWSYLSQGLLACLGGGACGVGHMDGTPAQGVVVEQQHGLLSGLRVAERDEAIPLQNTVRTRQSVICLSCVKCLHLLCA